MKNSQTVLIYAVRLPVIGKYTGQLLLVLALLTLPPFAVSLFFGEYGIAIRYAEVIAGLGLFSLWLSRISVTEQIQLNEALAITALAFVISPVLMSYPLQTADMSFSDALFETVSAITTTGLTTVTDLQSHSATFLFARAWTQWYGGLGIVVLSVSLYWGQHMVARQLAEPLRTETMATTARFYAQRMLAIYVLMTMAGLLILWFMIGDGFTALLYVLSAVSTGGFAPGDASLAVFNSQTIKLTIIALALCGSIPLPLYYFAWQKGLRELFKDIEFIGILLVTATTVLVLILLMYFDSGLNLHDSFFQGLLLGISAQTTSGFSSLPISQLDNSEKLVTICSMLVGGGVGSTAGGFKVIRLLILFRVINLLILRTTMPSHATLQSKLGGKMLDSEVIQRAMILIFLYVIVVVLSWFVFLLWGYSPIDSLFEVVSATGTVGLTSGITQTSLPVLLKMLLCFDMLLGRLEIVALLVLLYPRTWIGRRVETS